MSNTMHRPSGINQMQTVIDLCKRHGSTVSVYMLQIDYFADYEKLFGESRANQLLSEITHAINRVFGRSSDILCRFFDDTFVICSSVGSVRDAHDLAKLLCGSIEKLKIASANSLVSPFVTASIGYTIYRSDGSAVGQDEDMEVLSLLEEAEDAMSAAHFSGMNTEFSFIPLQRIPFELSEDSKIAEIV